MVHTVVNTIYKEDNKMKNSERERWMNNEQTYIDKLHDFHYQYFYNYQELCKRISTEDLRNVVNGSRRSIFITPRHLQIINRELTNRG
jgi:ABC-type xylose transport system substrate-binding protein